MAYKYSCRKCPIRNRCIEESEYTVSVRNMIQHAFSGRTDTLATWGLLQTNCLLVKAEEEQERRAAEESRLTRRLRERRQAREQAAKAARAEASGKRKKSVIRRLPQARKARETAKDRSEQKMNETTAQEVAKTPTEQFVDTPDYLRPVSPSPSFRTEDSSDETFPRIIQAPDTGIETPRGTGQLAPKPQKPCWLTVSGSQRHITLPASGEVVLGRFDATFGIPPDIDLVYEDMHSQTVSRRHAKIVGRNGYHTIEDTGSRHGVFVNGAQIRSGLSRQLKPGDNIAIGSVRMTYDEVPAYLREISGDIHVRHLLIITPTGRRLAIAPPDDIIIGRSDRYVDFVPDLDLSQEGEVAARVSRRHAIIYWRNDRPYLEDLGSGFGTRVNGNMMLIGQPVPLKPGDHIWLGGCVLAYDVEM